MTYEKLSTHELFLENPSLAWGFQTYLTKLYQDLEPHQGYYDLLNICKNKFNNNYFVITSNVDSQFLKSGFNENNFMKFMEQNVYGNVLNKNCNKIHYPWLMDINDLPTIDKQNLIALKPFPKCKYCNNIA